MQTLITQQRWKNQDHTILMMGSTNVFYNVYDIFDVISDFFSVTETEISPF